MSFINDTGCPSAPGFIKFLCFVGCISAFNWITPIDLIVPFGIEGNILVKTQLPISLSSLRINSVSPALKTGFPSQVTGEPEGSMGVSFLPRNTLREASYISSPLYIVGERLLTVKG